MEQAAQWAEDGAQSPGSVGKLLLLCVCESGIIEMFIEPVKAGLGNGMASALNGISQHQDQ